jgi:hypothetical protein
MERGKIDIEEIKSHIYLCQDKEWINVDDTNCYAYALGLDYPEYDILSHAYQLGVIGSIKNGYHPMDVCFLSHEERLKLDLKTLKIKFKEIDPREKSFCKTNYFMGKLYSIDYYWSIALYSDEDDFHFLRKGFDGKWYQKNGYHSSPVDYDRDNEIIMDPRTCNLGDYEYRNTYQLKLTRKANKC